MLLKLIEKFRRYIGITVGSDVEPEIKALAVMFEKLAVVMNEEQVDIRTEMTKQFTGLNRKIDNRNNTNIEYKTKLSVLINDLISDMLEIKLEPLQVDAIDSITNSWLKKTFKNTTFIAKSAKHKKKKSKKGASKPVQSPKEIPGHPMDKHEEKLMEAFGAKMCKAQIQ